MKKNIIDYRTTEFPTAVLCSNCESIHSIKYSLARELMIQCNSCRSVDLMLNLSPQIVQLKKWREQHLRMINENAFDDRLLAIVSKA